MTSGPSDLGNH